METKKKRAKASRKKVAEKPKVDAGKEAPTSAPEPTPPPAKEKAKAKAEPKRKLRWEPDPEPAPPPAIKYTVELLEGSTLSTRRGFTFRRGVPMPVDEATFRKFENNGRFRCLAREVPKEGGNR